MRLSALLFLPVLILASCGGLPPGSGLDAYQAYDRPAKTAHDPSAVRVEVSTSRQRAYVMEGDEPLLVMPVAVGTPATPTPTGHFRITTKEERRRSTTEGYASSGDLTKKVTRRNVPAGWKFTGRPLPYWCGFGDGCGFHTGWIKHTPCTDGCIRMHENVAPKFFNLVQVGTPVDVAFYQPEDRLYGNIPLPPDAGPLPDYDTSVYTSDAYFERHR
ncbi:L,D-transpeptidase [Haloferula sargassicola]|uniref:L,D-TPase catalytic domain-containing protein n=1 Tax=Haloferula sargassicola TaxID=490096 RepID=A0ABP9UQV6_9BACT